MQELIIYSSMGLALLVSLGFFLGNKKSFGLTYSLLWMVPFLSFLIKGNLFTPAMVEIDLLKIKFFLGVENILACSLFSFIMLFTKEENSKADIGTSLYVLVSILLWGKEGAIYINGIVLFIISQTKLSGVKLHKARWGMLLSILSPLVLLPIYNNSMVSSGFFLILFSVALFTYLLLNLFRISLFSEKLLLSSCLPFIILCFSYLSIFSERIRDTKFPVILLSFLSMLVLLGITQIQKNERKLLKTRCDILAVVSLAILGGVSGSSLMWFIWVLISFSLRMIDCDDALKFFEKEQSGNLINLIYKTCRGIVGLAQKTFCSPLLFLLLYCEFPERGSEFTILLSLGVLLLIIQSLTFKGTFCFDDMFTKNKEKVSLISSWLFFLLVSIAIVILKFNPSVVVPVLVILSMILLGYFWDLVPRGFSMPIVFKLMSFANLSWVTIYKINTSGESNVISERLTERSKNSYRTPLGVNTPWKGISFKPLFIVLLFIGISSYYLRLVVK